MKRFMVLFARLSHVFFSFGVAALLGVLAVPARAVTIDFVTVGNAGNATDSATGNLYGAVAYSYQIGKYDVTISQYTAFLNAADPNGTNPNGIYNPSMGTDLNIAGISYTAGASAGSKYAVINNGGDSSNRPITYVSWFDAARFANWMTNGQGSGSTETGAYTLNGATSGTVPARNPGAPIYIPTENEWYKAAYYSPVLNSGSGGYYTYATQNNTAPGNTIGGGANLANYKVSVYAVTGSPTYSATENYLTDVGAFSNTASYYGTFDQSGNVFQWNDLDGIAGSFRGLKGGCWNDSNSFYLSSSGGGSYNPTDENSNVGFRLAAVPEPSTCIMALAGLACGGFSMWRRRKRIRHGGAMLLVVAAACVAMGGSAVQAATVTWFGPSQAANSNATWTAGSTSAQNYGVAFVSGTASTYSMDWLQIGLNTSSVTTGSGSLVVELRNTTNLTPYSAVSGTTVYASDTINFTCPPTTATAFTVNLAPADFPNISSFSMTGTTGYALRLWGPSGTFGIMRTTGYANGTTNNFYTVSDGFVALDTFRNNSANYSNTTNSHPTLSIAFGTTAVPEPATYGMAIAGVACGGFSMWRRRMRA